MVGLGDLKKTVVSFWHEIDIKWNHGGFDGKIDFEEDVIYIFLN